MCGYGNVAALEIGSSPDLVICFGYCSHCRFPTAEKYLVWYYSRDAGALHDGQTGLSVIAGAFATSLVVFAGILLLSLIVQQLKTAVSRRDPNLN